MTNIFANAAPVANEIESDYVGGNRMFDTNLYTGTIKYAYLGKANASDARSVNLSIEIDGREHRETIWVSNKKGEVTYTDKKGNPVNLPGFNLVNSMAMLVVGKQLGQLEVEEKTLNLYDFDAKKELPKQVDCFVELHGEEVQIAILRKTVDKTAKNDATNKYEPTGETRDTNEIQKFMPASKTITLSELDHFISGLGGTLNDVLADGDLATALENAPEGAWAGTWLSTWEGKIKDESTGKAAGGSKSFTKSSGGDAGKEKTKSSLFD